MAGRSSRPRPGACAASPTASPRTARRITSTLDVDAPPAAIAELERQTNINEDVIRFLTIRVDEHRKGPVGDDAPRRRTVSAASVAIAARAAIVTAATAATEFRAPRRRGGRIMARAFFRRRKSCPFSGKDAPKIDYKDVRLLQGFVSERGKIVPVADHRRLVQEAA